MSPDPFDNMAEFEVGKNYPAVVNKVLEYGLFVQLKAGLSALCHQTELGYSRKSINPKTFAKVNDTIMVKIIEIDQVKRRISVSHRATLENPWEKLKKEVRVAVTGAASCVFRSRELEQSLSSNFSSSAVDNTNIPNKGFNTDIHASADYRAHIIKVMAKKAISSC